MTDQTQSYSASGMMLCKAMFKAYGVIGDKPEARAVANYVVSVEAKLNAQAEQIRKLEIELGKALHSSDNNFTFYTQEKALRRKLEARAAEADGQKPIAEVTGDCYAGLYDTFPLGTLLFTRPPITSKRELELLAVIEQMRGKISSAKEFALYEVVEQLLDDALALTPEAALKERDEQGVRKPIETPIDISKLELNTTYHIWENDGRMFAQAEGYEVVDITPQDWSKKGKS